MQRPLGGLIGVALLLLVWRSRAFRLVGGPLATSSRPGRQWRAAHSSRASTSWSLGKYRRAVAANDDENVSSSGSGASLGLDVMDVEDESELETALSFGAEEQHEDVAEEDVSTLTQCVVHASSSHTLVHASCIHT